MSRKKGAKAKPMMRFKIKYMILEMRFVENRFEKLISSAAVLSPTKHQSICCGVIYVLYIFFIFGKLFGKQERVQI